nr:NADH dehydrogenase subunit 3 [Gloiopeltis furcata]
MWIQSVWWCQSHFWYKILLSSNSLSYLWLRSKFPFPVITGAWRYILIWFLKYGHFSCYSNYRFYLWVVQGSFRMRIKLIDF